MLKLTLILSIFVSLHAVAQPMAAQFKHASDAGVKKEQLDAAYPAAINNSDPAKSVFSGQEKRFQLNYIGMLKNLNAFLEKKGFTWGDGETKCFNGVYFDAEGNIDYFLFNFYPNQIQSDREKEFQKLLAEFVKSYKFPLIANSKFSFSGPVSYKTF